MRVGEGGRVRELVAEEPMIIDEEVQVIKEVTSAPLAQPKKRKRGKKGRKGPRQWTLEDRRASEEEECRVVRRETPRGVGNN